LWRVVLRAFEGDLTVFPPVLLMQVYPARGVQPSGRAATQWWLCEVEAQRLAMHRDSV
jgi:hypothetical protein